MQHKVFSSGHHQASPALAAGGFKPLPWNFAAKEDCKVMLWAAKRGWWTTVQTENIKEQWQGEQIISQWTSHLSPLNTGRTAGFHILLRKMRTLVWGRQQAAQEASAPTAQGWQKYQLLQWELCCLQVLGQQAGSPARSKKPGHSASASLLPRKRLHRVWNKSSPPSYHLEHDGSVKWTEYFAVNTC